jgi:CheY-like chemotaxis protein
MQTANKAYSIVIAEDNPADVELVQESLREHRIKCTVQVVSDGAAAVQLLSHLDAEPKKDQIDLLIVDIHLPKRSGDYILKYLRSTENYAQTPVIVMTSTDSSTLQETALRHAAVSYFKKPLNLNDFLKLGSLVEQALQASSRRKSAVASGGESTINDR